MNKEPETETFSVPKEIVETVEARVTPIIRRWGRGVKNSLSMLAMSCYFQGIYDTVKITGKNKKDGRKKRNS
jgi:hypothetical protein